MKSSSRKFERPIWVAIVILFSLACATVFAGASDIAKWDPRMAASNAVIDTNGVKWIDGKFLPIEGRWTLGDTPEYYARLPNTLTTNVNGGVRGMRTHTSGMQFRFRTDSDFLIVRLKNDGHAMNHMTAVGTSGWDVYRYDAAKEIWQFVASSHGDRQDTAKPGFRVKRVAWQKGDGALINLPLYNGVQDFELGLAKDASVQALGPRKSGVDKPVVFYGTSITHGGCASRPGLGFVNIVGRDLDVPVCCLGFSGSGVMEPELSDVIARVDASCYVLDCLWNMRLTEKESPRRSVEVNYETFIRNLRAKRPAVPIVMAEQCDVFRKKPNEKDLFIRKLYGKLKAEDPSKWNNLVYLPKDEMYPGDFEGTVDGCHPNDLGMRSLATAFGRAVKTALGL